MWLEKLFGDKPVPSYELNQYTVGVLHNLKKRNELKEANTQLLIEDLRQKADEYNAEGRRLGHILSSINLTSASLSQSGVASLRTLANLALILQTKNASESSYILALQHLEDETRRVEESRQAELRTLNSPIEKTKTAVIKRSALKNALDDLEKKTHEEDAELRKQAKETQFIRNKAKEYKTQVQKTQAALDKTGIDPSVYHQALVARAEELEKLKDEIAPMKEQLQSYHGLPPDAIQAHMRLDELKEKVAQLEAELTNKIDVMLV